MDDSISEQLPAHADGLRRFALALTRNPADADDLVQECFVRALRYGGHGRDIENLRGYLYTILGNVHRDQRARSRRQGHQIPIDEETHALAAPPRQPARLEWTELARALEAIPDRQKQVVLLIGLFGHTYEAAAETLNVPIGTVMSRLSRGRISLREAMAG